MPSLNDVIPGVDQRFCVRHIYSNMRKKFPGKQIKEIMWRAANATYKRQWEREMEAMKKIDDGASMPSLQTVSVIPLLITFVRHLTLLY